MGHNSNRTEQRRRKRKRPGPKPSITLDVVKRVSERVGRGSTLVLALAAEGNPLVNLETWKKALGAHPEFSPHYEAARGKFLDAAMERLAEDENIANLRWLLERRHSDLFSRPAQNVVNVSTTTQIIGLPDDVLERARAIAQEQPKGASRTGESPKSKVGGADGK